MSELEATARAMAQSFVETFDEDDADLFDDDSDELDIEGAEWLAALCVTVLYQHMRYERMDDVVELLDAHPIAGEYMRCVRGVLWRVELDRDLTAWNSEASA